MPGVGPTFRTSWASSDEWPDAKVVYLEDNYRSTAEILAMANRLIGYNTKRHDKTLIASRPKGPRPRIEQHKDEITEAKSVVGEITKHDRQASICNLAISPSCFAPTNSRESSRPNCAKQMCLT